MTHDLKLRPSAHLVVTAQRLLGAPLALGLAVSMLWSAQAVASQALAQKYTCVACHQPAVKVVGPSWKDISTKYGEGKGTVEQLATSIKAGSNGKWGPMPMPPQAQVPDADLQAIAKWLIDGAKQ